jgi:hypothetical protein
MIHRIELLALRLVIYSRAARSFISRHVQSCLGIVILLVLIVATLSWKFWTRVVAAKSSALAKAILGFAHGHPALSRVLHVALNAIPDVAFALLAIAGLSYLMPDLTKRIEKSKSVRVVAMMILVLCRASSDYR